MSFGETHPGHKRSHNEDCYVIDPELRLYLVADGVGGHADGEVAAAIVRDTLQEDVAKGLPLIEAIHRSHRAVLDEINRRIDSNMGSTVVAALISESEYDIAWVGDSRAYLFNGELRQISRDHNPVSEMLARGAITAEQAAAHPERNVLSQSLGVSDTINVAPGRIRGDFNSGDQLILCSDGLTDEVSDTQIAQIMARETTVQSQVKGLINAALKAGGRDNVTVVVIGEKGDGNHCATNGTLGGLPAVEVESEDNTEHDSKVLLLLGIMAAVAVAWVALRIF
ncbi:PP2C family serine/threonine-protein phosphatase [Halioglobus sp. HI00S01]|uniref:PP2C family protein-serine/threonine phosphatase n=1 Tax=Halioglobus sp. HI00S01 TaxID=1822214 RepID=UPI0009ED2D09|nr:protein phosphatase 2C domain-containing protein [Halioglobus sp. HI00S01]